MKRHLLTFLTLLLFLTAQAQDTDNGYRIVDWVYQAQVHKDNSWTVAESMTVEFQEPRHGIYRYIPRLFTRHHAQQGGESEYTYLCNIEDVRVDGADMQLNDADDQQENLIIRIGSADREVTGRQKYTIRYTLVYPEDRYPSGDELVHTVLGTDCNTSIDHFSFDIRFDEPLPAGLTLHALSGSWGSNGNDLHVMPKVSMHSIHDELTHIPPFQGITLQADLPEGFWQGARSVSPIPAYLCWGAFFVFLLCTLGYQLLHHRKRPLMVIEYNAPEGISSAEVGTIIDDSADQSDLTSLIIWWASKGHLKITETDKKQDIRLTVLKPLPTDSPTYQQIFWNVFFKKSQSVLLSALGDKHEEIAKAQIELEKHFHGERKLVQTKWSAFWSATGMYVCAFLTFCLCSSITSWNTTDMGQGVLFCYIGGFIAMVTRMWQSDSDAFRSKKQKLIRMLIYPALAAVCLCIFQFLAYNENDYLLPLSAFQTMIVGVWLVAMLGGRLKQDTEYRKEKMSLLLGFKEFIKKAEMPMLKAQVDENPSYFYDVLPYAIVFGLSKKWQKQFESIDMPTPNWYEGRGNAHISSLMVADRLSHHINDAIIRQVQASSHDPKGSSSSTSSFVGGGGGGGGVGSW